jgi:hypothetical protein
MDNQKKALLKASLIGGGSAGDGEHVALLFRAANEERFALTLKLDEYPGLVRAAALFQSELRKRHGGDAALIPVESWSAEGTPEMAVLALKIFGGLELRFQVSQGTKEQPTRSQTARH